MAYPIPWHNTLGYGLTLTEVPDPILNLEFDGVEYPAGYLPEELCEGDKDPCHRWMYKVFEQDYTTAASLQFY